MQQGTGWSDFSSLVQTGMRKKGFSLRELCRRAEMDPSLLSKVLAGKRYPPTNSGLLSGLASALDISAGELFVSVGLLPEEWSELKKDRRLFEEINGLLKKGYVAQPRGPEKRRPAERTAREPETKIMPEELL